MQAAAVLLLAALAVQLARVQLAEPPGAPPPLARGERVRSLPVEPRRGLIVDRNGVAVARNAPQFSLAIVPGELPDGAAARLAALRAVERESGVPYAAIERALSGGLAAIDPFAPLTLRRGFAREAAAELRAALAGVPGVRVRAGPVRTYGGGDLLAHVLGYVGPIAAGEAEAWLGAGYPLDARVGRAGVEYAYESELRGGAGERLVIADAAGRELRSLGERPARTGADLVLSIDLRLQRAAAAALERGIERGLEAALALEVRHAGALERAGAAVVMDARDGELLALATYPSYDANVFSARAGGAGVEALLGDGSRPLIHRAFMEAPAPGSVFKPLVGAAALQEGVAAPDTRITSTGAIGVRSPYDPGAVHIFRDWAPHGTLDFYGGLARSSDVYYYYLAGGYEEDGGRVFPGLGADRLARYARAFGLGTPTGIDLPGEAAGLVPDREWKEGAYGEPWVLGDTYNLGIGQGFLTVTPLQMAVATAALANGGEVLAPRAVRAVRDGEGLRPTAREVLGAVPVDGEHLAVVREALRRAADPPLGTARRGEPEGLEIGGKTGTAEFGPPHPDGEFDSHGWFVSFAPWDDPRIVVVVYLRHGVGALHAAPVAREIYEAWLTLGGGGEPRLAERLLP